GVSDRLTNAAGSVTSKVETDPLGTQVDDTANYNFSGNTNYNSSPNGFYGDPQQPQMCSLAGFPIPCSIAVHLVNVGMYDQSDLVFGNPWSIQNLQLTIGGGIQGGTSSQTVTAGDGRPYTLTNVSVGLSRTINFGGHARDFGY